MITRIGAWLIGGVVVVVLIGTVLGTPVFIGHVQTTSMEPALSPGDGFVAVAPLGGEPVVGQTVVYRTQEEPRRLIVHQIVEKRQGGYVTQGLNSPFSDQAGGAPLVAPTQVQGVVVTAGGDPVALPAFGHLVVGVGDVAEAVFGRLGIDNTPFSRGALTAVGVGLLALGSVAASDASSRRTRRAPIETVDNRLLLIIILIAVAVPLLVFIGAGSSAGPITFVSDVDPIRQGEYPPGTNQTSPYEVTNGRLIPEVVILEAEGADARFVPNRLTIGHGESATVTFHLSVPPTEGQYTITHAVHRYPAVLPPSVIHHLHRIAAPLASAVILGVILLPIIIIFQVVVGPGRTRLR